MHSKRIRPSITGTCAALALLLGSARTTLADVSWTQEGRLGGALKVMTLGLGKVKTRAFVKGDGKREETGDRTVTITRIDRETVYTLDLKKKTYSRVTFEQMREEMRRALEEMDASWKKAEAEAAGKAEGKGAPPEVSADVEVKESGRTETIAGFAAKEVLLLVTVEGTDPDSGQKGAFTLENRIWLTTAFEGWREAAAFDRKLAEKLGMAQVLASSGMADSMQRSDAFRKARVRMTEAAARLEGFPLRIETRFGAPPQASAAGTGAGAAAPPPPAEKEPPRRGLGGLLGKIKGKGDADPGGRSAEGGGPPGLFSFVIEVEEASTASADAALFEVPERFKEVPHESRWSKDAKK